MATNFHDALKETLDAAGSPPAIPKYWFGAAPEGSTNAPPYAVIGAISEAPNYGSVGVVEYMQATTQIVVTDITADNARAGAALIRAVLGPNSLAISGKKCRLYQDKYSEDKTGDRGPQGEFLYSATISLMAEIS